MRAWCGDKVPMDRVSDDGLKPAAAFVTLCAILAPAQTTELPDPTFIKQIEEAFKEYPEEKLDALCAMKTRVCVAIVENWGENDFRLPHRKK